MTHSTHFIYGYMASDIWLRTILIGRKETSCRHIGYSFSLTARVLLYAPSHRQDSTYHGLCYTSHVMKGIIMDINIYCKKRVQINNGRNKEGSVLCNDTLNTFSYGYMVVG